MMIGAIKSIQNSHDWSERDKRSSPTSDIFSWFDNLSKNWLLTLRFHYNLSSQKVKKNEFRNFEIFLRINNHRFRWMPRQSRQSKGWQKFDKTALFYMKKTVIQDSGFPPIPHSSSQRLMILRGCLLWQVLSSNNEGISKTSSADANGERKIVSYHNNRSALMRERSSPMWSFTLSFRSNRCWYCAI